ncbi:GNAT family N-acetyltransferase [Bacillus sp. V59.32b]|uniref:GNAT family N-acetyltransferase n=1 Tax=Bacillus sp. V59.32b TaxID=1758642 RepID=UPI000E3E70BD|nr:GNAT family N-acetyltransferase [Bacillus sp. V59.32b]RFU66114.1 GNAT family N-acetyltransferase [Bacillus sp. V59.32b]
MEQKVYLIKPTIELKSEYLSFYQEWKDSGKVMVPWVIGEDPSDFQAMVNRLQDYEKGENLPGNWIFENSTLWLIDHSKKVIGVVNIRHRLTERLLDTGGHIGYGIRPSERRKGYATEILSLCLQKAKELGIDKALVVCDQGNTGSEKAIVKNGGIPGKDYVEENGNVLKRYWIEI